MLPISSRFKAVLPVLAILVAGFICYANVLSAPFIWDDEVMVVENPLIKSWDYLDNLFEYSAFGKKADKGAFYRPIQILTYLIDYQIWGLNPMGFRLTNLFFHLINGLLVLYLFKLFGFQHWLAFLTALFFTIHPVQIEAVTYISGRGDLLFLFFSLLCFISFCWGHTRHKGWFLGSLLLFPLAFFTKENAIVLPFIMALYIWLAPSNTQKKPSQTTYLTLLLLMAMSVGYASYRLLGSSDSGTLSAIAYAPLSQRLLTLPKLLLTYIRLMILPFNLHMEYHFVTRRILSVSVLLGTPLLIALGVYSVRQTRPKQIGLFFLLWFLFGLGTVMQVALPLASTLREHWLYLPSIGFIAWVLYGCHQAIQDTPKRSTWLGPCLIGGFIFYFGALTIHRNLDWRDPIQLYSHDLALEPGSFVLHNNLGVIHYRLGDIQQAKLSFLRAIHSSPSSRYGTAHNNLGVILEDEGDFDKAGFHYQQSIITDQYRRGYLNRARLYMRQEQYMFAVYILKEAIIHYPLYPKLHYMLGVAYLKANHLDKSKEAFLRLKELAPHYQTNP